MCADSLVTSSTDTRIGFADKIFKNKHGWLFGMAGHAAEIRELETLFGNDIPIGDYPKLNNTAGIVVDPTGKVYSYDDGYFTEVRAPYYAEGSGQDIVLGAFYMGATAYQAVEAAIQFDCGSGGPIQTLKL